MGDELVNSRNLHYDIIIVGGGLIGSSLAIALRKLPLRIAMVEKMAHENRVDHNNDARTLVLSYGSQRILGALGIWPCLAKQALAITRIHVSSQGHFAATRLCAQEKRVPAFGYVASMPALLQATHQRLQQVAKVDWYCPAQLVAIARQQHPLALTIKQGEQSLTLTSRVVIAADGARSAVAQCLQMKGQVRQYRQQAIVANVQLQREHEQTAYERFTREGPIALLPQAEKSMGLVWGVGEDQVGDYLALNDAAFLARLQRQFGYRLGRFLAVSQRLSFPLQLIHHPHLSRPGIVFIGNAAQSLHPIAGQGFNLGLRDVATLAEVLVTANDVGLPQCLADYAKRRRYDRWATIAFTDFLVTIFSLHFQPLMWLRSLGFWGVDTIPFIKHPLMKHAMGMAGKPPKLACGLAL